MQEKVKMIPLAEKVKIVPLADGQTHLLDTVKADSCIFCGKERDNETMVLVRMNGKEMVLACLSHPGVLQEFIKQYNMAPIGWSHIKKEI